MKVCLDAGHGEKRGLPTGASSNHLVEDTLAYDFVTRIGHHLRAAGHTTVLTRPTKHFVELKPRAQLAKREKCDLFLSIHLNAAGSPNADGAECLVAKDDLRSKRLAEPILGVLVAAGMDRRGVKWDDQGQHKSLFVLRNTYRSMPAVLVEIGFLTNVEDAKRIADPHWRERVSREIAAVVIASHAQ